jgi:hypothetical protein
MLQGRAYALIMHGYEQEAVHLEISPLLVAVSLLLF